MMKTNYWGVSNGFTTLFLSLLVSCRITKMESEEVLDEAVLYDYGTIITIENEQDSAVEYALTSGKQIVYASDLKTTQKRRLNAKVHDLAGKAMMPGDWEFPGKNPESYQ